MWVNKSIIFGELSIPLRCFHHVNICHNVKQISQQLKVSSILAILVSLSSVLPVPRSTSVSPRSMRWILLPISSLDERFAQQLCQLVTIHPPSKTTDITGSGGVKTGQRTQLHLSTPEHLQAECSFHGPKRSAGVHYQPTLSCASERSSSVIFQKKSLLAINN